MEARDVDLVVQDMNFTADTTSGEEGIALFRALRERDPDLFVLFLGEGFANDARELVVPMPFHILGRGESDCAIGRTQLERSERGSQDTPQSIVDHRRL
jgi:hypothetical protein